MVRLSLVVTEDAREEDYPLRSMEANLELELDFGELEVPPAAQRRMAVHALQRIVNDLEGDDLTVSGLAPVHSEPSPTGEWIRPAGIDMRIVKSAHKVVREVAKRGETGRAVLASELVQDGLVSAPTMSRLLRDDETAGQYMSPYVTVNNAGRTKALDLTPKGRLLASKIRAGVIPE